MIEPSLVTRCAAGIASGALLSLAFASPDASALAWVALVPLLLAARGGNVLHGGLAGLLCGLVSACGIFSWLLVVPAFGAAQFIVLGLYIALYPACWCAGVALLSHSRAPLLISAPALWVALEALRGHAGFLALPWATLAQSQHTNLPVLQVAAWGGEAAVSFVVVMGNVAIAALAGPRAWRSALAGAAAVGLAHAIGAVALSYSDTPDVVAMAAVQPNIGILERESDSGRAAIWQRLERLTRQAAPARPAAIVWPETAVGDPAHDARLGAQLAALSHGVQVPLIVGASETEKFMSADAAGATVVGERDHYNAAYLVVAGAPLGAPYRKRRLVPFGEYLPLKGVVPWPRWLVPEIGEGKPGEQGVEFQLQGNPASTSHATLRVGVLICWENLFAELSREAVRGGADVLVQLTNDAWFGRTRASAQHNAASVLRAVENHVPVVIASNTGASQIIDSRGRVLAQVPGLFEEGITVAQVGIGGPATLYSRTGDVVSLASLVWVAGALSGLRRRATRTRTLPSATLAKEAT